MNKMLLRTAALAIALLPAALAPGQHRLQGYGASYQTPHYYDPGSWHTNAWYGSNNWYNATSHYDYIYGYSPLPYGEPDANPFGDWYDYGEYNPEEWAQDFYDFDEL